MCCNLRDRPVTVSAIGINRRELFRCPFVLFVSGPCPSIRAWGEQQVPARYQQWERLTGLSNDARPPREFSKEDDQQMCHSPAVLSLLHRVRLRSGAHPFADTSRAGVLCLFSRLVRCRAKATGHGKLPLSKALGPIREILSQGQAGEWTNDRGLSFETSQTREWPSMQTCPLGSTAASVKHQGVGEARQNGLCVTHLVYVESCRRQFSSHSGAGSFRARRNTSVATRAKVCLGASAVQFRREQAASKRLKSDATEGPLSWFVVVVRRCCCGFGKQQQQPIIQTKLLRPCARLLTSRKLRLSAFGMTCEQTKPLRRAGQSFDQNSLERLI